MANQDTQEITEQQADDALRQVMGIEQPPQEDQPQEAEPEQPTEEQSEQAAQPEQTEPTEETDDQPVAAAEETEQTEEAPQPESDDVASLKQRMDELEESRKAEEERFNKRLEAIKQRESQNTQIMRDRLLRKSTVADKALKLLKTSQSSPDGVPQAEVDRLIAEIESTMNPASPSYVPPQATPGAASDDQVLVLNQFLNERGMTSEESEEFGKWVRDEAARVMSPTEQAIANESLGGFLHLAHLRWNEAKQRQQEESKRTDAVKAVKTVQRTQKAAAKAATAPTGAPKKPKVAASKKPADEKLSETDITTLLRQAVEAETGYR